MAELRLARIDPVHIALEGARWEQRRQPRRDGERQTGTPHERLIAAAAPGVDPDSCEVDYVLDGEGNLKYVIIHERASGRELARIAPEALGHLTASGEARGLLFERRG